MNLHQADHLYLHPLSSQIKALGGEGYNTDVKHEAKGTFGGVYTFTNKDGEYVSLELKDELQVGVIDSSERMEVYLTGSGELYGVSYDRSGSLPRDIIEVVGFDATNTISKKVEEINAAGGYAFYKDLASANDQYSVDYSYAL